ncbi:MFS transporter [Virgibacillus profundi]|uniref:MFS transporter n=1 Tax=Virgibacillus profundi TaxID=2024555 RepID=A0A2A2IAJ6_9BACI|nr:MFS transporter [Virgibacillus profundi]PAV29021.1 MFS transporter [Virgibacillus profundi]PXY53190.1 MFS transporter [Virgibacillus profundi]
MNNTFEKRPVWTKDFIGISVTHLIIFLIFYTLLTTLPIYVIQSLGGNEAQGGLLVTVMLLAAILVRPISGRILEVLGKKNTLMITVVAFAITTFFYLVFDQYNSLLILRFIHGLSFGIATTATGAIAADTIPGERKGEGLGYFAMATNVAMVIGPFIGLTMLQITTFKMLFVVLSILILFAVVCALIVKVPKMPKENKNNVKRKMTIHDIFELKALPIASIAGLISFAYAGILSFISVYANALDLASVASYFFVVFAFVMIITRPSFGRAFDSRGPSFIIIPSLIAFAIGLVILSFTQTALVLLLAAAIIGLGYGSLLPSFQTMAVQSTDEHRSGHATATFFTMYDIGIASGTYVLGIIVTYVSFRSIYIICAAIILVVLLLFSLYQLNSKKGEREIN